MAEQQSFISRVSTFVHKHPIITNLLLIIVAGLVLVWLILSVFLGVWTRHGDVVRVPDVKGMTVAAAEQLLESGGYEVKLDSIFDTTGHPGIVLEQSPHPNTVVKEGRTIYITYACYSQKRVRVPMYYNMSRRQAIATFEEIGLRDISVREVPSEYPDLVISAKYNGVFLQPGSEIPVNASIVLEVGSAIPDDFGLDDEYDNEDEELIDQTVTEII